MSKLNEPKTSTVTSPSSWVNQHILISDVPPVIKVDPPPLRVKNGSLLNIPKYKHGSYSHLPPLSRRGITGSGIGPHGVPPRAPGGEPDSPVLRLHWPLSTPQMKWASSAAVSPLHIQFCSVSLTDVAVPVRDRGLPPLPHGNKHRAGPPLPSPLTIALKHTEDSQVPIASSPQTQPTSTHHHEKGRPTSSPSPHTQRLPDPSTAVEDSLAAVGTPYQGFVPGIQPDPARLSSERLEFLREAYRSLSLKHDDSDPSQQTPDTKHAHGPLVDLFDWTPPPPTPPSVILQKGIDTVAATLGLEPEAPPPTPPPSLPDSPLVLLEDIVTAVSRIWAAQRMGRAAPLRTTQPLLAMLLWLLHFLQPPPGAVIAATASSSTSTAASAIRTLSHASHAHKAPTLHAEFESAPHSGNSAHSPLTHPESTSPSTDSIGTITHTTLALLSDPSHRRRFLRQLRVWLKGVELLVSVTTPLPDSEYFSPTNPSHLEAFARRYTHLHAALEDRTEILLDRWRSAAVSARTFAEVLQELQRDGTLRSVPNLPPPDLRPQDPDILSYLKTKTSTYVHLAAEEAQKNRSAVTPDPQLSPLTPLPKTPHISSSTPSIQRNPSFGDSTSPVSSTTTLQIPAGRSSFPLTPVTLSGGIVADSDGPGFGIKVIPAEDRNESQPCSPNRRPDQHCTDAPPSHKDCVRALLMTHLAKIDNMLEYTKGSSVRESRRVEAQHRLGILRTAIREPCDSLRTAAMFPQDPDSSPEAAEAVRQRLRKLPRHVLLPPIPKHAAVPDSKTSQTTKSAAPPQTVQSEDGTSTSSSQCSPVPNPNQLPVGSIAARILAEMSNGPSSTYTPPTTAPFSSNSSLPSHPDPPLAHGPEPSPTHTAPEESGGDLHLTQNPQGEAPHTLSQSPSSAFPATTRIPSLFSPGPWNSAWPQGVALGSPRPPTPRTALQAERAVRDWCEATRAFLSVSTAYIHTLSLDLQRMFRRYVLTEKHKLLRLRCNQLLALDSECGAANIRTAAETVSRTLESIRDQRTASDQEAANRLLVSDIIHRLIEAHRLRKTQPQSEIARPSHPQSTLKESPAAPGTDETSTQPPSHLFFDRDQLLSMLRDPSMWSLSVLGASHQAARASASALESLAKRASPPHPPTGDRDSSGLASLHSTRPPSRIRPPSRTHLLPPSPAPRTPLPLRSPAASAAAAMVFDTQTPHDRLQTGTPKPWETQGDVRIPSSHTQTFDPSSEEQRLQDLEILDIVWTRLAISFEERTALFTSYLLLPPESLHSATHLWVNLGAQLATRAELVDAIMDFEQTHRSTEPVGPDSVSAEAVSTERVRSELLGRFVRAGQEAAFLADSLEIARGSPVKIQGQSVHEILSSQHTLVRNALSGTKDHKRVSRGGLSRRQVGSPTVRISLPLSGQIVTPSGPIEHNSQI